jgi:hypothetical protein
MRRLFIAVGLGLVVAGALAAWAGRAHLAYRERVRAADRAFAAGDLEDAIAGYESAHRELIRHPVVRYVTRWLRTDSPDRLLLQIGNARFRQAEILLIRYGRARRDPRITERPALDAVRQRFAEARRAWDRVTPAEDVLFAKARFNAVHAGAMEFLVDLWLERTKSDTALRGELVRLIRGAAAVLDHVNARQVPLTRDERMRPVMLLETFTQFAREARRVEVEERGKKLGEFLKVSPPQTTEMERRLVERFLLDREEPVEAGEGELGGLH